METAHTQGFKFAKKNCSSWSPQKPLCRHFTTHDTRLWGRVLPPGGGIIHHAAVGSGHELSDLNLQERRDLRGIISIVIHQPVRLAQSVWSHAIAAAQTCHLHVSLTFLTPISAASLGFSVGLIVLPWCLNLKGDDRSFSKWLPSTCYFGYTVSITTCYVGLWH